MARRSSYQMDSSKRGLLTQTSFTSVEDGYRNVLQELSAKQGLEDIAAEYNSMFEEIQGAKQTQQHLINKNNKLQAEIDAKIKEIQTTQASCKAEKEIIQQLEEEAKRNYPKVCEDKSQKEKIEQLWPHMLKTNKELEEMAQCKSPHRMLHLTEVKERLLRERQYLMHIATVLKKRLAVTKGSTSRLQTSSSTQELQASKLQAQLQLETHKLTALQGEQQILEEKKIAALEEAHMVEMEYNTLNDKIKEACLNIEELEDCTKDMQVSNEKMGADKGQLQHILATYHAEYKLLEEHLKQLGTVFVKSSTAQGDTPT